MDRTSLALRIDHTVLGPTTTEAEVDTVLEEAREYGMNACIPPCYLDRAAEVAPDTTVATVIGFPHGQHDPTIKRQAAQRAEEAGADELDVVANIGRLLSGQDEAVTEELSAIVDAVDGPVKLIVQAPSLDTDQLERACECVVAAGADMVKTATGFGDGGARRADVELLSEYLPVKASGGIDSYDAAEAMLDAGAERIGASSGVAILEGAPERTRQSE